MPGLIGAPTYPMLRDATLRGFFDVLEYENVRYEHNKSENIIRLPDSPFFGSEILCRAVDEFERLRGTNLAWFGLDELTYCRPEAWLRLEGRLRHVGALRRCGFGAWTPKGFDWVYEKFVRAENPDYFVVMASPRENVYVEQTGLYDTLQGSYDSRLYQQEVLGEYLNLTAGSAYYAFDRHANVAKQKYDHRYPLCWALDFNVTPMSSVIFQIRDRQQDVNGHGVTNGKVNGGARPFWVDGSRPPEPVNDKSMHVLDEIYIADSNTPEACAEFFHRAEAITGGRNALVSIYGDASGGARQTIAGAGAKSDWEVVRREFKQKPAFKPSFRYKAANPHVRDRIAAVNSALRSSTGERRLFIDPACKNLIKDLEQVTWKAGTTQLDKDTDKMLSHISDAMGYAVEYEMPLRQPGGFVSGPRLV